MDKIINRKDKDYSKKWTKVLDNIKNLKKGKSLEEITSLLSEEVQDDIDDWYPSYTKVIKNIHDLITLVKSEAWLDLKEKTYIKKNDNETRHLGWNYKIKWNSIELEEALYRPGCLDERTNIVISFEKINRHNLVQQVEKSLIWYTSTKEPWENKDDYITKFYETTEVFHTNERLQDNLNIIPLWYVNDWSDDFLDVFYNKNEKQFECLWYTDKYFDQYKQILKLNNYINPYIPDTKINVKKLLSNIHEWEFITETWYHSIEKVFEKFLHNIDYDDQYWIDDDSSKKRMFEVWENWDDEWMTRELDIIISYDDKWPKYFVDYINNSAPLWKQIIYDDKNWWQNYPFKSIWEHLELNEDYNEVIARENYMWDRKTDISTLKDYQKVNIINYCGFRLIRFANKYSLEDSQKRKYANIENDKFNILDNVIKSLETYIHEQYNTK